MPVEKPSEVSRPDLLVDIDEPSVRPESGSLAPVQREDRKNRQSPLRGQEWFAVLLYIICDVVCWIVLYALIGYARRDAFFVSPFEFVLVDFVALGVILQALYIIGGYNRNTDTRSLTYTAEHILAIAGAAVVSSALIYSAATFDAGMKPSRGVLLLSFIFFLPFSIVYRRFFRERIAARTAQRVFLVIGSG